MGINSTASSLAAIAIGNSSSASTDNSLAIGATSSVTGLGSMAFGNAAVAAGATSFAIGAGASTGVNGLNCVVFGSDTTATTANQTAIGYSNTASASNLAALFGGGFGAVTGDFGISLVPAFSINSGSNSYAIGAGNVSGNNCVTFGTAAVHNNCFMVRGAATAANQIGFGSNTVNFASMYLGRGPTGTNTAPFTIQTSARTGTNVAQSNFTIRPGTGTGTGTPASLILQTDEVGTTGTTAHTRYDRINISGTAVVINEASRDMDFRVESGTVTNALFIDGGNDTAAFNVGLSTLGRIKNTTRNTTATYTVLPADDVVFMNTDAQAATATLSAGVEGQSHKIINSGSSGNDLTVTPAGAEHLIGANSSFALSDGETLDLTYNATDGWY